MSIATRLVGVALIVLLIACANVANLMLARGLQRRREIAVRLALGVNSRAPGFHSWSQRVLLLAVIGGVAAVALALWGASILRPVLLPVLEHVDWVIGWRPAAFIAAVAMLAGLAAGLVPALQASRPDVVDSLKAGAREGTVRKSPLRAVLLVLQTALSIVLLAGPAFSFAASAT